MFPSGEGAVDVASLSRLLAHLTEPLLLASTNGRILAANVGAAEILGTTVEALVTASLGDYAPDWSARVGALVAEPALHLMLRARDGRRLTCEARALSREVLIVRLSGGLGAEPRARAFLEALSRLHRITSDDGLGADDIFRTLIAEGMKSVGAAAGGLFMVDEAAANLELTVSLQFPEPLADRYRIIPLSAELPLVDTVKTKTANFLCSRVDYQARYPDYAAAHPSIVEKAFVALPLVLDGRCVGAMALGFGAARSFTRGECDYLAVLAHQCANALAQFDANRVSRRGTSGAQRLERLQAFTGALAQTITPAQVIDTVMTLGLAATGARAAGLWLLSPDGTSVVAAGRVGFSEPGGEAGAVPIDPGGHTPILDAIRASVAVWIESRSQHEERYPDARLEPLGPGAFACLPLFVDGRCTGAVAYGFDGIHRFSEDERSFLLLISWYAAQALERAWLYAAEKAAKERAEADRRRSDFLADIGVLLASSLDYSNILADVASATVPRFADWCVLELVDERLSGTVPIARHADPRKAVLVLKMRRRLRDLGDFDGGLSSVMRSGVSLHHPRLDPEQLLGRFGAHEGLVELMRDVGVGSSVIVPISARGQVLGAVLISRSDPARAYDEQDLACAEELGRRLGLALDNARLYQEARNADRAKDEFLAMLSHELRNPLAPILLSLELMDLEGESRFAGERAMIARHVRHVVGLIEDLLDVSRITRGKVKIERELGELAPIVAAAVDMAAPQLEDRKHRLIVSVPERGLLLSADRGRLTQAIVNLLTNAAKYTEPGGIIALTATGELGEVVVRVQDSGIGIAPELLPRIFDLFMQGQSDLDRSHGGLGIGLTIVKSIVTLHEGTISAHSAGLGQGSEFVMRLPLAASEDAAVEVPAIEARSPSGDHCRVLAVDDNVDAALTLGQALGALGCTVQVVHDGAAALAALPTFAPELVLLDIGLPGMDGYEVARRLRSASPHPALRIVAVTGYGQSSDRVRSRDAGFDDHVVKPVSLDILRRVLAGNASLNGPRQ
jgi:signal transduction histidine kinase/ActR/RegA family two-component response regulator